MISATPVQLDNIVIGKKYGVVMQHRADSQEVWFLFFWLLLIGFVSLKR